MWDAKQTQRSRDLRQSPNSSMDYEMRIVELIRSEVILILPQLNATNKEDVLRELARFVAAHHSGLNAEAVERVLAEREQQGSTAVEDGLAIPHAKYPSLRDHLIGCLGRSRKGIAFGAPDDKPTHFFFALIAPEDMPGAHLKALARVSRLFRNATLRKLLTEAETATEMYDILAAEDRE